MEEVTHNSLWSMTYESWTTRFLLSILLYILQQQYSTPLSAIMPINVAILGSGVFAEAAYIPGLKASSNDTKLHTIWSRSQKSAEKLHAAAKSQSLQFADEIDLKYGDDGLQAVLDNKQIEGVMIVLPITAQPALVIRCLEAGKHVLSEKPIGKDVKTAKALVEEYEKRFQSKGLIWRVAESESHQDWLIEWA